jgi:Fe-S cluster assembly protein SufD
VSESASQRLIAAQAAAPLPAVGCAWVDALRGTALERFRTLGLPGGRDEAWKYTRLNALEQHTFAPAAAPREVPDLDTLRVSGAHVLVFVNGAYRPDLSTRDALPAGLRVLPLAEALERDDATLREALAAGEQESAFTALNTAYLADGVLVEVAAGQSVSVALQLLYVAVARDEFASHPRNVVVAGANSALTLVESYVAPAGGSYFTNAVTELRLAQGARVEHVRLQGEADGAIHIARVHARVARDASYASRVFSIGAQLARTEIDVRLAQGAECDLDGLYMVEKRQHVDHQTTVEHAEPHASSREFYKGILDGASRAVFSGRVLVQPDAQKTDAQQMNQNLLLSPRAEVDTKPQLEIYADDVKCSHGATVGQLDAQELFYLRTRGLDEIEARNLLIHGFANELVDRIADDGVRAWVYRHIDARLPGRGALLEGEGQ